MVKFCIVSSKQTASIFLFRTAQALQKLKNDVNAQKDELKAKNIHQKGEVLNLKTGISEGALIVKIEGQIIAAGSFEGINLSESQKYDLRVIIDKNTNLTEAGLYPFLVSDFVIRRQDA